MGAATEVNYCYEPDVAKAFNHLVEEAAYDHGHSGYSGTIAEANGYSVYDRTIRTEEEANEFAWHLANEVAQKWEAALAIPFVSSRRRVEVVVPEYDHPYDYAQVQDKLIEVALAEVTKQGLLQEGEMVTRAPEVYRYEETRSTNFHGGRPSYNRRLNVHMRVYIDRAPNALTPERLRTMQPDGWFFGGCYSC